MTDATEKPAAATPSPKEPQERFVSTEHRLVVGKKTLDYTATCGTVLLREDEHKDDKRGGDKARAEMFFVAYTLKGVKKAEARPVTFSFNGGPGSSSVWLHLGILGPHRVVTDEIGNAAPPPYALCDNVHTLLLESDLVFIDPVGTGHSRMAEGEKATESRSRWYSWNSVTFSPSAMREWPVPTGSMKTRSLSSSSVCTLSHSA